MLTKIIEQTRQAQKIKIQELAKAMGINPTTYARKIKSLNGFTDLECSRACKYLNLLVYVLPEELKPLQG